MHMTNGKGKGKKITAMLLAAMLMLGSTVPAAAESGAEGQTAVTPQAAEISADGQTAENAEPEQEAADSEEVSQDTIVDNEDTDAVSGGSDQQSEDTEASVDTEVIDDGENTDADADPDMASDSGNAENDEDAEQISEEVQTAGDQTTEASADGQKAAEVILTSEITDAGKGTFTVTASGLEADEADISAVLMKIWVKSDKSDLKTYTAEKDGSDYKVTDGIAEHGYAIGNYKIAVYVRKTDGSEEKIGGLKQAVSLGCSKLKVYDCTDAGSQKIYKAAVSGLYNYEAITEVKVAVWSETGEQDDLKWISLSGSGSTYTKKFRISDFQHPGTYQAHFYVTLKNGKQKFLASTAFKVTPASVSKVTSKLDQTKGKFKLTVSGITAPSGVEKLSVRIWHKSDKSDRITYTAVKSGSSYTVSSYISKFNNALGTYYAAVYIKDGNGFSRKVKTVKFSVNVDKGSFYEVQSQDDGLTYHATLHGAKLCKLVSSVQFGVWSEKDGKDDLKWYTAKYAKNSGNYYYYIPIANHMDTGTYQICARMITKSGKKVKLAVSSFSVLSIPEEQITISNKASNGSSFKATVTVVRPASQIGSVLVPVWCSSDQSDLVWYTATKVSTGKYEVTVKASKHQYHFGTYHIGAYLKKKNGQQVGLCSITTKLKAKNYLVRGHVGSAAYRFTLYGATLNGSTPSVVYFPTWSKKDGQDDLVWYQGENDGDGNFTLTVYMYDHGDSGTYYTHVYLGSGSQQTFLTAKTYTLKGISSYNSTAREVMRKIIYAVETGGQVYGNCRYDDFTMAYTNSSNEHAITIGAGCWYATEAKELLSRIRKSYPATFKKYDTAGIGNDLDNCNWSTYGTDGNGNRTILKGSAKAVAIQNIINSAGGRKIQDQLVDEQMEKYIASAQSLGVKNLKACMFLANVRHLGGYGPMEWVVELCKSDGKTLTMRNLYSSMRAHTTNPNGVGADLYNSRHVKVMGWLDQYIG